MERQPWIPEFGEPWEITESALSSSAGGLVSERFAQAEEYAGDAWTLAWDLLNELQNQSYVVDWEAIEIPNIPMMGLDGLGMEEPTAPDIADVEVDMPEFTAVAPELDEPDIPVETAPEFTGTEPAFNIPDVPTVEFPLFTATEPQVQDADVPTAPDLDIPVVPELSSISIPSPPEYSLPSFDGVAPSVDLTPPEPMYSWNEAEYSSDVKTAIAAKLLTDIVNGGSGLDEDTEQAIYDRATARQELENQQLYDEASEYFSSRGHTIPPGALAGQLLEASYKITQVREDLNNDILVKQSDLAQTNTHFIIDRAIQSEKDLMGHVNSVQQRAFESAKFVVESAVTIYGIKVEGFKAQLEAYKALAEVFVAKIRAEMGKAELYKAQIAGVQAGVEAEGLLIDRYRAQLAGIQTLVDVYKAEMEAANVKVNVDRAKIENFKALVDVFVARIGAVNARYGVYQTQIAGETEKAKMYAAQVGAYQSRVEAFKAVTSVDLARAETAVALNRGRIESYVAAIDKYKAEVTAAIAEAETLMKGESLDVSVYEAKVRRFATEVDATVRTFLGRVEETRAHLQLQTRESEVATNVALAKYGLTAEAVKAAATVAAQLAASAMSSVSASAALGFSENRGDTTSYNKSLSHQLSVSDAHSTSYNHYYDETKDD